MTHEMATLIIVLVCVVAAVCVVRSVGQALKALRRIEEAEATEEEIQMTPRINRTTDMDSTIETKHRQRTAQSFQNPVKARQVSAKVRRSRRIK